MRNNFQCATNTSTSLVQVFQFSTPVLSSAEERSTKFQGLISKQKYHFIMFRHSSLSIRVSFAACGRQGNWKLE